MADELLVIGEEAFDTETNQPVWWDGEGWSYVKPRAPLTPQIRPANMPLSYAQQRLWFLDQLGGGASAEYNMPEAMRLRGELDLHALTRAINTIVARHESLRTHFAIVDGEPVQIIEPMLRIDVPVHDLRSFGESSRQEAIDAALRREWQQPFDLQRGPLLRVNVLELGERDRILLWTSHHIVSDGWSIGVISHELVALYEAFAEGRENPLEPLSIQYADFALWQRAWMEDGGLEEGLRYWKEQLRGIPERLELPADHPRPATQTFAADAVHASFSSDELAPVMRMTQAGGATLFMTLLATFAILLERYSGQDDIVIGSPIANRRETQLERLIGFFVNSLVMRVRVRTDLTFRELLAEVRQTTLDAYQHQDVPFERLVEELSPERNLSATPIFQVAFVLQNAPGGSARLQDLEIERVSSDELRVRFDMEIHAVESDGALTLAWVYNRDLFERWRIEQMARHFVRLLADAASRPDVPLHRLRMQEQRERYTLLEELNATSRPVPPATFPRIFEEQVARTPDAIAIVSADESLTYAELNTRANRLAHHLLERGVGPDGIVGISMLKSIDQWIAVLATMKAGAAYLPLDPDYPEERIQMMLADANPMFVLDNPFSPREGRRCRRRMRGCPAHDHDETSHNPTVALSLHHPAYIIYTSGSTGIPKGVVVTHAGIASLRAAQAERFAIDANARVLQFASLNFDASFAELAVTLGSGAALVLPHDDERSGSLLRDLIARQRITHATLPPTVLATLDEHDDLSLQTLIVAGEPCPPDQVDRWSQGRRFINAYGPTETTVCATMSVPLSGAQTPPIGAPNLNTRVYVLDAALEPVPMGVNGELYVAGISLARGYLHRPGLTASRFVADPHGLPGTRMYRTGDVVRWRADGALDFIGRVDEQVKLRGFRIEPGEIEEALRRQDRVHDALVTIHGDGDQKQLLGYVTIRDDDATQSEAQATHISHWQQLYDATHAEAGEAPGDFNIRGWNSSYTGEPIPAEEMRIWVEETVARILGLQPRRVLEIGCGTGLLLTRIAPSCEQYIGIDFSAPALAQLERYRRTRRDLDHVMLRTAAAHELSFLDDDSVDVVIINSVVQYFPDTDYLFGVLDEAARVTRRGGAIFIGDVRSLPLLDTFHASLSAHAKQNEKELVLDPALFSELARRREKLGRVEVALKAGAYDNELSRFRYDVTLHVGAKQTLAQPERWIEWDADGAWREEVARTNSSIGIRGIPDARVLGYGEDPDAVMRIGLPYAWQSFNSRAIYDCIVRPQWIAQAPAADAPRAYYRRFGNEPLRGTVDVALSRSLQDALRKTVPEHMVPSAIVVMQSWPLTPSGKIDRRALPVPRRGDRAVTGFIEPQSETAKLLASLWESVLGLDRVGEQDNFFSLGGHSLMAAQLMSRVRDVFGVEVSVRTLFDAPQLRELAQSIEEAQRRNADIKPPLRPMERPPLVPLSYAQRRLWFLDKLQGASAEYNMPGAWRLRGALDVDALRRTLDTIVARHENLRVHFVERDGEPFQEITSELRVELPIEPATMDEVRAALQREAKESFDLNRGPLLRARLLRLDDSDHVLLLTLHHIVSDAWSMGVLHREFAALYEAFREGRPNPLPPLSVQYADFALWQRSWLDGDAIHRGLEYWKSQLAGIPDRLELQTDRPRPPVQTFVADVFELTLPPHRVEALKRLAQSNQATLFMTLLSAFAILLERYSGQRDIVLGTPIANRQDRQLEDLIGFFVNSLVMRIDVRRDATFRELLLDVRRMTLEAYQHQDIPFERLVEELSLERSRNSTPIFQVVFAMQNAPSTRQTLPDLQIEPLAGEEPGVRFDLEVHAVEGDGALQLSWVYNRDLFDRWRIEQMARDYTEILAGTPASSPPSLLSGGEGAATPAGGTTAFLDATALIFGDHSIPYRELHQRANRLANHLIDSGITPDTLIGLDIPRSAETIIALLGITKAGGAYVPISSDWPTERREHISRDLRLIVDRTTLDAASACSDEEPRIALTPNHALYVNFTSGSTGEPKGVLVLHGAVVNLVRGNDYVHLDETTRILHYAPLSFDAATFEIWGALLNGGAIVIVPPGTASIEELAEIIVRERVDTLWLTAGLFHQMVDAALPAFANVKQMLAGGDVLSAEHVERFRRAHPQCRVINGYGPTENTTFSCCHIVPDDADLTNGVPIGAPIHGRRAYVLNASLEPVPLGVAGELYVAGEGLARGYLARPALTAERFVADPFQPGARMYRTGDRVRTRRDGTLEFLGRVDNQVKIRGFRIEPGEIEAVLQPFVAQAAVIAREDGPAGKQLVAYVVPKIDARIDEAALRLALARRLPDYMMPGAFVVLDALPLTRNGKLDRRALPAPERISDGYRAPRTPEEEILCGIFAEVLGVARVGIDDDFFALGGHSLVATRVVSRVRATLNAELAIRTLFDAPTPAQLASRLHRGESVRAPLEPRERPERLPLSYAQQRLWFLYRIEGASAGYNIPLALRLEGDLDAEALEEALRDVVERHESLRTIFPEADGVPYQKILSIDEANVRLTREHVSGLSDAAATAFELREEIPLRAWLFTTESSREHVLLLLVHHIAADGWSLGPLSRDLGEAYAARIRGEAPVWRALPVQYADYALWQREWLADAMPRQLEFWRNALAGAPEELPLPLDRRRPATMSYRGDIVHAGIDATLHRKLHDLARATGASLFMVLQAALAALLAKLGAGSDIPIGTPVAGRGERATEELIGFFVNTLVLRTDVSGDPTFRELVARVRKFALDAYAQQDLPFEQLVEALKPERSLARHPLFQVMLLLDNTGTGDITLPGLMARDEPVARDIARYDLTLAARERLGEHGETLGIDAGFEYSTDLFDRATAESMAVRLLRLLEAAVTNPDARLHQLDVLDPEERAQLSGRAGQETPALRPTNQGPSLDARDDSGLTYAHLRARVNRIANHLIARGVGPEHVVAIALERSIDMVAAILGILKSGAAYLPLDPEFPRARLDDMLADAQPAFVIDGPLDGSEEEPRQRGDDRNPAYVLYTSGSTGRPKGVVIEHRALATFLDAIAEHVPFAPGDRHLAVTTIGFDISILEIIAPLQAGAEVWLADRDTARDPIKLGALIRKGNITSMQATPSHWRALVETDPHALDGLRILTGGEALPRDLARTLHERGASVINLYGPTEATIWASAHQVSERDVAANAPDIVSIGRPLAGYRMYVLDPTLEPVPFGVTGELYIGGAALARGYLRRPALTAERFVADPHAGDGARMYRTGDLARRRSDGAFDFLGRADEQLKIRGFRIEPGEIENVLKEQDGIAQAAVVARDNVLVAYVVGEAIDVNALRVALSQRLPDYMIPAAIVPLERMPLTPNGKLDRRALPAPEWTSDESRAPRTEHERILCDLFADVLAIERAGIDDNFFAIGGHSLLATRLVSRIRDLFEIDLPLKTIFDKPTVAGIAEVLAEVDELTLQLDGMSAEELEAMLRQEEGA